MNTIKQVLLAEDSSVIQHIIKKILTSQYYEVTAVKNGRDVLQQLEKNIYDILLLDINMPIMDGMKCTRIIRASENATIAQIPIVAITGNAKNYSVEEFKELGINEYLPKPLDFDRLLGIVNEIIRKDKY